MSYGSSIKVTPEDFLKTIDLVLGALEDVPSDSQLRKTEGVEGGVASNFKREVDRTAIALRDVAAVFSDDLKTLRDKLSDTLAGFIEQEAMAGDEAKNLLSRLNEPGEKTESTVSPAPTPSSQSKEKVFE
ncbi:hypothetical protein [Salinibacterium sp. PAMC 21357]|uniref:hypothetical protein n=1 Tax=Salinibacterium sp. PAMC 21357 TaxID=1112215 RepID=UPI000289D4DE|nr:hypothetical protein [Salinibacterium sp. PAMC 21357]